MRNEMTVSDLVDLYIDPDLQTVILFDLDEEKSVYCGPLDEVPEEYTDYIIGSLEPTAGQPVITINITLEY